MKKLDKEDEELDKEEESVWDIQKIATGLVVLGIILVGAYYFKQQYYPDLQLLPNLNTGRQVRGVRIEETPEQKAERYTVENIKSDVQNKINTLTQQVNNLDATEIASSSPQVQKVLEDIKNLQNYPKNQAKEMCMNICSGL